MRILSMDGGIATALNLRLLRHLESRRPGFLARTELFAGTSDGALAVMFLASRMGPDPSTHLRALDDCISFFHEVLAVFQLRARTLASFTTGRGPEVLAASLRSVFARHLGTETLDGLARRGRNVLVLALEKQTWKRRVFHGLNPAPERQPGRSLVDLALSCSSFPVVLPPHRSEADGREYLDAALVTNNPALVAVREALAHLQREGRPAGHERLSELRLLSLGATESCEERGSAERRGGLLSWLPGALDRLGFAGWPQLLTRLLYLPDFMIHGSVDIIDLQCAELLGPCYRRVRPSIPEFDYLASIALPPERLMRRLDEEARRRFGDDRPELAWIDAQWLPPAEGESRSRGA